MKSLQAAMKGKECISKLEQQNTFLMALSVDDKFAHLKGESNELCEFVEYGLRIWDVQYYLKDTHPTEAIDLIEEGIDEVKLDMLAARESCFPLIRELEKAYGKKPNYFLDKSQEEEVRKIEDRLFASLKIEEIKGKRTSTANRSNKSIKPGDGNFNPKLRDSIFRRDKYRCFYCGGTSNDSRLEVNHIIPRNLIRRFNLNEELFTADYNLITTCFQCNRGKSDYLHIEDINRYFESFDKKAHPNHKLLSFLTLIKQLQEL
jgi:5-methylcytosine-specific restriction endonuclease McrA